MKGSGPGRKIVGSLLALRSVLLLLASCAPLLSPAFLLSTSFPQEKSCCFLGQGPTSAVTERCSATAATSNRCHNVGSHRRCSHKIQVLTSGRPEAMRTSPVHTRMSARPTAADTDLRPTQDKSRQAFRTTTSTCSTTTTRRSRKGLVVLSARGGGRSGGDSSRRRTDRPDEYSSDRKKGKGSGGRGGRAGRSGGRGGSSSAMGSGTGAPSPFETSRVDGELWGGESRLSTLDDRPPAEFSRKIDSSELSRKPKYFSVEATEKECAALAQRFSCEAIADFKADLRVVRAAGSEARKIKIKGRVVGSVTQNCAATLEPFVLPVEREFNTVIQEVSLDSVESTLWALEQDTETDDEIMEGDPLDLGEVAAQSLALCIDPFAKHPDFVAQFGTGDGAAAPEGNSAGRFGMPADGEGMVLDVDAMRAFFDADD